MRKNLFYMSLLASMAFAFTACSDGDKDDEESLGNENEACMEGNVCNGDLVCENDICVKKSGAADGAEGGKCLADNKCNGELVCENNVCKAKSGAADGAEGGKCLADNKCNGELVCENNVCKAKSGPADGAEGGACKADGSCDKYLACDANVCKAIDDGKLGGKCGGDIKCDTYLNCNVDVCEAIDDGKEGGKCLADNKCDGDLLCKADVCVAPGPGDKNQACREDGYCNGSLVCAPDDNGNAKCVEVAAVVEELVKSEELIAKAQKCLFTEPEPEDEEPIPVPSAGEEGGDDNAQAKNLMEMLNGLLVDENVVCGNYLNQPILDVLNDLVAADESTCQQDLLLKVKLDGVIAPSSDYFICLKQSDYDLAENFDALLEMMCTRTGQKIEECVETAKTQIASKFLSDEAVCASQYNDALRWNFMVGFTAEVEMAIKSYEFEYNAGNEIKTCMEKCPSNDDECMSECSDVASVKGQIAYREAMLDVYNKLGTTLMGVPADYVWCLHDSDAEMSKKAQSWIERECNSDSNNLDENSIKMCIDNSMKAIYAGIPTPDFCADEYKDSIVWQRILDKNELADVAFFEYISWWNDNAEKLSLEEKFIAVQRFPEEEIAKVLMNLTSEVDGKYQACLNNESDLKAVASSVLNELCEEDSLTVFHELMNNFGYGIGINECKESIASFIPEETSACSDELISYIINVFPVLVNDDSYRNFSVIHTNYFKDMMICVDNNVKELFDDQDQYDDVKANYAKIAERRLKEITAYMGVSVDPEAFDYALYFMYDEFLYQTFLINQRNKENGCAKAYIECGIQYGKCIVDAKNDEDQCDNAKDSCIEVIVDSIMDERSCNKIEDED